MCHKVKSTKDIVFFRVCPKHSLQASGKDP